MSDGDPFSPGYGFPETPDTCLSCGERGWVFDGCACCGQSVCNGCKVSYPNGAPSDCPRCHADMLAFLAEEGAQ